MDILSFDLPTQEESEKVAARLASCLNPPLILTFRGEIGAGKTTIIRAMLRTLGINSAIKSPTFSLVESYTSKQLHIHHFDLYRIHDEAELEYIGFRDYFSQNAVCCIEWPERVAHGLDHADVEFNLTLKGAGREMMVRALSAAGVAVLSCIAGVS